MIDPVVQDTDEHHEKLARFNRAVEVMVPIVREDVTVFEGFLMDEYPDIFKDTNDTEKFMCTFNNLSRDSLPFETLLLIDGWDNYVLEEAKRRVEG